MAYLTNANPQPLHSFTLQTCEVSTGTPETVVNDLVQKNPLGALIKVAGNVYRYVLHAAGTGTVATAAASPAHWKALSPTATTPLWTATADSSDGLGAGINDLAGIYKGVVTDAYYTFLAVGGVHLVIAGASTVTSDMQISSASDSITTRIAAGGTVTAVIYGIAIESLSATVASQAKCILHNLIW